MILSAKTLTNLNFLAVPACLGGAGNPDATHNDAYEALLRSLNKEEVNSLLKLIQQAHLEAGSQTISFGASNSYEISKIPATNGNTLLLFQKTDSASDLQFAGYRKDSDVPGFTVDQEYHILDSNYAARTLQKSAPQVFDNGSLVNLMEENALRFVNEMKREVSYTTRRDKKQFEVRIRPVIDQNQLIVRIEEKTNTADIFRILREQMQPYEGVLRSLRIGFYQSTPSGKFLMVNDELARILGYDSSKHFMEEVSDSNKLYVHEERRPKIMEHLEETGQILDSETELYKRDGTIAKVSGSMVAIKNDAGEIALLQGTVLDISAASKQDRILKMLKSTLYDVNDSINIANLDDEIIYVNKAFTELYGYEPEEVIGKKSTIFWSGVNPKRVNANVKDQVLEEGGYRSEVVNRTKYGREMVVSLSASVIRDELDNPIAFIAIARDVTRERESEKTLLDAKRKAEEASHLKSIILSNMSHELRTPLTGIIGFASILIEQLEDSEDSDPLYFLENIKKAGERLLQTMNNILLLAELESRTVDLKVSETNLYKLLQQNKKLNQEQAVKSGLTLEVKCPKDLVVRTDQNLIVQILAPLIDNAFKFTEKGGVVLSAGMIESDRFYVSVKDSGIGIDLEYVEKIFEPFTQISSGIRRKYQGSGLGLHICKRYSDMLEAEMVVISEPEKGAEFKIIIPLK